MSAARTVRSAFACLCVATVLCLADGAADGDVPNGIIAAPAQRAAEDRTTAPTRGRWPQEATDNGVAEYRSSATEVRKFAPNFTREARARPQVSFSVHASELRDANGANYDLREYTGNSRLVSQKNVGSFNKRTPLGRGMRRRRALDLDSEPRAAWSDPEGALTRTAEWFVLKLWMPIQELAGNGTLSSKCLSGLLAVYGGVRRGQLWALKFLDATGKFPSGVLSSSSPSSDPGSYDECLEIGHIDANSLPRRDRAPPAMEGRYCSLQWVMNATSLVTRISDSDDDRDSTNAFKRIRQGVCVPSHCSRRELEALVAKVLNGSNTSVAVSACRSRSDFSITQVQLAVICIFIVWITLIAISTLVHFYWNRKESSTKIADSCHRKLTLSISAVTSIKRLLLVRQEKHVCAVQPLKTVSLLWIVLGMTYRARLLEHGEYEVDRQWRHGTLHTLATSSDLAYTTVILLSGYAAANTVLELHKLKVGFVRRLLAVHCLKSRLTASALFALGAFVLYPLFVDGPAADRVLPLLSDVCRRRWGFVVVHLNNLQGHGDVCYHPLWFISCEMQIFVALSGIVVLIRRFKRTSCIFLTFIGIVALAAVSAAVGVRGYQPPVAIHSREYVRTLSEVVYLPFLHAPAFIIGVLFNNWITRVCRVSISKCLRCVFWLLSAIALVWGALYPCIWTSWVPVPTAAASVLFIVGLRLVWCVAIAYVLWAATTWKSGLVRDVLGCRTVAALGRLSLGAYLCSWMIVMHGVLSARNNPETAHAFLIRDFVANTVLSYAGALLFYVACDGPAQSLCSLLRTLVIGREAARRRQSFDECDRKVRFLSELLGMESPRTAKELQQQQPVSRTLQRFSSLKDMVLHL